MPNIIISQELINNILSSSPYIPIYKVNLEREETLKLKYIGQHTSGAFLYSSNKGTIGFKHDWVVMPAMSYNNFMNEYFKRNNGKEYFEITPEITLKYISYSNSGFATAHLDRNIVQFKPIYHPELNDKIRELEQKKIERQREYEIALQRSEMEREKRKIEEDRKKQRILELDKQRKKQRRKKKRDDWIEYQINDSLTGCGFILGGAIVCTIIGYIYYLIDTL